MVHIGIKAEVDSITAEAGQCHGYCIEPWTRLTQLWHTKASILNVFFSTRLRCMAANATFHVASCVQIDVSLEMWLRTDTAKVDLTAANSNRISDVNHENVTLD
jgi:hypothetical protein